MRPRIYLDNGRWHVFTDYAPCLGFILMRSAFSYAAALWKRRKT